MQRRGVRIPDSGDPVPVPPGAGQARNRNAAGQKNSPARDRKPEYRVWSGTGAGSPVFALRPFCTEQRAQREAGEGNIIQTEPLRICVNSACVSGGCPKRPQSITVREGRNRSGIYHTQQIISQNGESPGPGPDPGQNLTESDTSRIPYEA